MEKKEKKTSSEKTIKAKTTKKVVRKTPVKKEAEVQPVKERKQEVKEEIKRTEVPTKEPVVNKEVEVKQKELRAKPTAGFVILIVILCLIMGGVGAIGGAVVTYYSLNNNGRLRELVFIDRNSDPIKTDLTYTNIEAEVANKNCGAVVSIETDTSIGSGVIITKNGYILTNYHVINSTTTVVVSLYSGETKTARIVSSDQTNDIAILKIDGDNYQYAKIGDSNNLALGEKVVIIGNPTGQLPNSITTGIVSYLNRKIRVDSQNIDVIQLNAAINSGNSGGGLFNINGELVGIINAKAASTFGVVDGIGFAIPINNVMEIVTDLLELGYYKGRIMVGLSVSELNKVSGEYYYHIAEEGLFVAEASGDAKRAGIQAGDYIVSVDGALCPDVATLRTIRDGKKIGDSVTVKVIRVTGSEIRAKGTGQITSQQFYTYYFLEEMEFELTFTQYYPA